MLQNLSRSTKSDFYYSIFIDNKFQKSVQENKWNRIFNIKEGYIWKNVYVSKIKNMYEKRIAEFNYKLLNDILNNNVYVSKWNRDVSPFCSFCNIEEDIKHVLYDCEIVKPIWEKLVPFLSLLLLGKLLYLDFTLKSTKKHWF